jgi:hypothetical protein
VDALADQLSPHLIAAADRISARLGFGEQTSHIMRSAMCMAQLSSFGAPAGLLASWQPIPRPTGSNRLGGSSLPCMPWFTVCSFERRS